MQVGPLEIVVVIAIALLVFGPKGLPQLGRSLGRGLREFRKARDEIRRTLSFDTSAEPPRKPEEATAPEPTADPATGMADFLRPGAVALTAGEAESAEAEAPGLEGAPEPGAVTAAAPRAAEPSDAQAEAPDPGGVPDEEPGGARAAEPGGVPAAEPGDSSAARAPAAEPI